MWMISGWQPIGRVSSPKKSIPLCTFCPAPSFYIIEKSRFRSVEVKPGDAKRALFTAAAIAALAIPRAGQAIDPFEQKLSPRPPDRSGLESADLRAASRRCRRSAPYRRRQNGWSNSFIPIRSPKTRCWSSGSKPFDTLSMPLTEIATRYAPNQNMAMNMVIMGPMAEPE